MHEMDVSGAVLWNSPVLGVDCDRHDVGFPPAPVASSNVDVLEVA